MSGDVQPRKRKDKKKKKDEGDAYVPSSEDLNIHVHKEGGTGGNICAKIVFFFLFSALIVLVGLIIKENQGLNELESVESESRFSQIFEGWIDDKSVDDHDDHSPEVQDESGEVDNDQDHSQEEEEDEEDEETEDNEASRSGEVEETEEEPQSEEPEPSDEDEDELLSNDVEDSGGQESEEKEDSVEEKVDSDEEGDKESGEIAHEQPPETENEGVEEEPPKEQPEVEDKEEKSKTPVKGGSGEVKVEEAGGHEEVREDVEAAEKELQTNAAKANKMFEALLDQNPFSPRLLYGKAKALDALADQKQSNELLLQALSYYARALNAPAITDQLFLQVAERYIDRARFMGQYKKAIAAHWQLIDRFPQNNSYLNNLAVTYLTVNMVEDARSVLQRVLSKWPNDGFALVHYGFILKTKDNNLQDSVEYMTKGIRTRSPGVIDGRFYFHLGDALTRLNRRDEAFQLYEEGVQEKVFKSKYQRSLYNIDRLQANPWWEPHHIPLYERLFSELTNNWKEIRQEGLLLLNDRGYFEDEAENLKDTGTWKQLELFARGKKNLKNCAKTPVTCSIVQKFPEARDCKRGQIKFSVMHPGTHVWPHCGPTNCRLRVHLGLKVPADTFIKVAEETRSWKEGDVIVFDDSFEHEVWHNGTEFRLVLIVDVWHPNLTTAEKRSLSPI